MAHYSASTCGGQSEVAVAVVEIANAKRGLMQFGFMSKQSVKIKSRKRNSNKIKYAFGGRISG